MKQTFDFLIIGSGIAGLNFALQVAEHGKVAIVTKKELMESNSNYAQGGIAAVLDKYDSFDKHIQDTLKAGCFLNNKKAVEIMVKQAPKEIKRLIKLGVGFNRHKEGLDLTQEGGHSKKRIAHAKDATGKEIERALIHNVRNHKNITCFESHLAMDLIIKDGNCLGVTTLNEKDKPKVFFSKATILATGGAGQVYQRNSNPKIAAGDGIAMAHRAGAKIEDMEFIQFHPTALDKKGKPAFLISESLRGEGAILKNSQGKTFMKKYHPKAELAPRDIVARAIVSESRNGNVYLDIRHKGSKFIKQRFPYIYEQLWWYGIKMDKDLIPISPAAHFICGGIHTDLHGKTSIPGLFAFGEVAHTGVHGANRLASNSLLECMVFSSRAVRSAITYIKNKRVTGYGLRADLPVSRIPYPATDTLKNKIQSLMWNDVGIVREPTKLEKTLQKLQGFAKQIEKLYNETAGKTESSFRSQGINKKIVELKNLNTVAILITKAALDRKKSIGCHFIKE